MQCWAEEHKLSQEVLLRRIRQISHKLGRSPTRRECSVSTSCYKYFGSWNAALIAAGLIPHRSLNQRIYKRTFCKAADGHICDSVSELIIDNWFFSQKITHEKDVRYPNSKHRADWKIPENIYVEYFGLANESIRYDLEIQKKKQFVSCLE